jgi:hypothetical protein
MTMVLKLAGEGGDQPRQRVPPHAPRKVRPLAVRNADLLALKASRDARLPPSEALGGIASGNRAVENHAEAAPARRAN